MMKRSMSLMVAALLSLGILAGCGSKPTQNTVTLKIGQLPVVDGLPFWVAEKQGYYKEEKVNVELVTFKSADERDAAMMSGAIDGMLADPIATTTLYAKGGAKVQITSVGLGVTQQEGPMGILAAPNSGITSVEQLKGQEIVISNNSVMHYVTEKLLQENGFKPDEIKTTNLPSIPVRFESLMSGKIKAAILPDPLFTLAKSKGAKVILDDAQAKQNYSMSVIAFSEKAIKEKPDGIRQFFAAYNRAVSDIKSKPDDYMDLMVEKAKLPVELKTVYRVVPFSPTQAPKQDEVESVVQWLLDKQIIKAKVTYEELVNTSFLNK